MVNVLNKKSYYMHKTLWFILDISSCIDIAMFALSELQGTVPLPEQGRESETTVTPTHHVGQQTILQPIYKDLLAKC